MNESTELMRKVLGYRVTDASPLPRNRTLIRFEDDRELVIEDAKQEDCSVWPAIAFLTVVAIPWGVGLITISRLIAVHALGAP